MHIFTRISNNRHIKNSKRQIRLEILNNFVIYKHVVKASNPSECQHMLTTAHAAGHYNTNCCKCDNLHIMSSFRCH